MRGIRRIQQNNKDCKLFYIHFSVNIVYFVNTLEITLRARMGGSLETQIELPGVFKRHIIS